MIYHKFNAFLLDRRYIENREIHVVATSADRHVSEAVPGRSSSLARMPDSITHPSQQYMRRLAKSSEAAALDPILEV